MIERFDTALGRFLYSQRLGIAGPVLANICHARGMNRFTLRGKVKVDIQWKLYTRVRNIVKVLGSVRRIPEEATMDNDGVTGDGMTEGA